MAGSRKVIEKISRLTFLAHLYIATHLLVVVAAAVVIVVGGDALKNLAQCSVFLNRIGMKFGKIILHVTIDA